MNKKKDKRVPPDQTKAYDLTEKHEKLLMSFFEQGYSQKQIRNEIRKIRGTFSNDLFYRWKKQEPRFKALLEQGLDACQSWWEMKGMDYLVTPKEITFNQSAFIFQMKNRFREDYTDEKRIDLTSKGEAMDNQPSKIDIVIHRNNEV